LVLKTTKVGGRGGIMVTIITSFKLLNTFNIQGSLRRSLTLVSKLVGLLNTLKKIKHNVIIMMNMVIRQLEALKMDETIVAKGQQHIKNLF